MNSSEGHRYDYRNRYRTALVKGFVLPRPGASREPLPTSQRRNRRLKASSKPFKLTLVKDRLFDSPTVRIRYVLLATVQFSRKHHTLNLAT
ncbi:hypothetical protein EVAR_58985_1 [Eumeta japonica]|uniref:Uncharacterized protein n=1 Tax=Eumeta variegata TaxID=151549 RepID=A0A4C1YHK9_EUMVA|nr:hypothetical protein EVAR_58985_1 [Eumeta japonica]